MVTPSEDTQLDQSRAVFGARFDKDPAFPARLSAAPFQGIEADPKGLVVFNTSAYSEYDFSFAEGPCIRVYFRNPGECKEIATFFNSLQKAQVYDGDHNGNSAHCRFSLLNGASLQEAGMEVLDFMRKSDLKGRPILTAEQYEVAAGSLFSIETSIALPEEGMGLPRREYTGVPAGATLGADRSEYSTDVPAWQRSHAA